MERASALVLSGWAAWAVVPLAALLAWAIVRLYLRETSGLARTGRAIRLLRGATVALLVLLLSQPVLHRVFASFQPPVAIVLRDRSESMKVRDLHEPPAQRIRTAILLGLLDASKRDGGPGQAVALLAQAEEAATRAEAALRQAQQLVQENAAGAEHAAKRLHEAGAMLHKVSQVATESAARLAHLPESDAKSAALAQSHGESAAKLRENLTRLILDGPGAALGLGEHAKAAQTLREDLKAAKGAAQALQDQLDADLAAGSDPEVRKAMEELERLDRAALADRVLDQQAVPAVKGRVKVVNYALDTDLREWVPRRDEAGTPERYDTDLATPLVRIAERHAQDSIAAVVIVSDGRHTSGPIPEDAARVLEARGIALHVLGAGSVDAPRDLCIAKLDGTRSVFLDETIRLTAHVRVSGLQGQKAQLVLRRGEEELQKRELTLGGDGWRMENFEFTAERPGPNVFRAAIEPLEGEALKGNNAAEAVVDVAGDRLKVLLVDELPRWETRYIASLLRRERKMTLDERWLQWGEGLGARPNALPEDEKALEAYEIVVLGDVPPERLSEAEQKRLERFVTDQGGFLVLVAGPKALPQSYRTGPLADLLPIRQKAPSTAPVASSEAAARVRVKLSEDGAGHEIVRILRDPALNAKLWPALPELPWVARPAFAKPGATPLLKTDDARGDVVAAVQHYGAGRVMYIGTDRTWAWRYKVADRVHAFFWSQAVRWGSSNRLIGGPRLKAGCARREIKPGEAIEVLARPRDAQGRPLADAELSAELPGAEAAQRVRLQAVPDSGGLYRGYLQNLPEGIHTVRVSVQAPGFENIHQDVQVIAREIAGQEGVELARDTARLAAMAKAGGGQYLDILEAPKLFEELAGQGREVETESSYLLWASYPILILVVALLAIEWILRKRAGLA